ncbi:MAG: phytanoyl-CoA dioxygenase family protein [Planctomycetota bacterium]|nr:phytanoyl-CoA dioxygenase family protein [Planctomycetota bacterium]
MKLSPLQIQHYETFGYLIVRDFLAPARLEALRDAVTRLKTQESGEADPLKHRGRVLGMFHKDPVLLDLFDDADLSEIAATLLRDERPVRFLGDEYTSYSAPADWHCDMLNAEPFESLKFGFYLDDLSRGGCLRVVPGSHTKELSAKVDAYRAMSKEPPPEIDGAYSCMTNPGDLLVFNLKLWHQGTANAPGTHRRVIFWSLGQEHETFNTWARNFHDKVGRGKEDEPWPTSILDHPPARRRALLEVYPEGTRKQAELAKV